MSLYEEVRTSLVGFTESCEVYKAMPIKKIVGMLPTIEFVELNDFLHFAKTCVSQDIFYYEVPISSESLKACMQKNGVFSYDGIDLSIPVIEGLYLIENSVLYSYCRCPNKVLYERCPYYVNEVKNSLQL